MYSVFDVTQISKLVSHCIFLLKMALWLTSEMAPSCPVTVPCARSAMETETHLDLLSMNDSSLTALSIDGSRLSSSLNLRVRYPEPCDAKSVALGEALKTNTTLKTLKLRCPASPGILLLNKLDD